MFHWLLSHPSTLTAAQEAACPALLWRALGALATALLISLAGGHGIIAWLRRRKVGERTDKTPIEDQKLIAQISAKAGTPTMGGVIILAALLPAFLLWCDLTNVYLWLAVGSFVAFAALGMADDWMKLAGKSHRDRGLKVRHKLIAQGTVGALIGIVVWRKAVAAGEVAGITVPLLHDAALPLGPLVIVWIALVVATMSNAVNVTDGLDGLATGLSIVSVLSLGALAFWAGIGLLAAPYGLTGSPEAAEACVLCAALVGALTGFLYHNLHPARVFMGDTGALAIGGIIGTLAVTLRVDFLLPLIGFVFLVEFGSSVLQVLWFKATGKRILPISPVHHIFQQKGWPETRIVAGFHLVGWLIALISLVLLWSVRV